MLNFERVSLHLNNKAILLDINLTIRPQEMVMMLGSNGSGKSSLLKLIDRRYAFQQGKLTLDSVPIERYSNKNLAKTITTLTQNPLDSLFPHLTVKENLLLACARIKIPQKITPSLKDHLAEFNPKLVIHLDSLCINLSGGEQQALVLALACLVRPKILLLDEHTSALDPHTAENLMRLTQEKIRAYGITCIISTHHLDHAVRYGDRLIALQQGKVLQEYSAMEKKLLSIETIKQECY
jgi:putative ABC transport system ATP-binding protein